MSLLSDYAVYQESPSQVSGRGGLRTELPRWEAERYSHSYLSLKTYNFSAEGLKCQTIGLIVSVKTSLLKLVALYFPCVQLYCLCFRNLTERSHFECLA